MTPKANAYYFIYDRDLLCQMSLRCISFKFSHLVFQAEVQKGTSTLFENEICSNRILFLQKPYPTLMKFEPNRNYKPYTVVFLNRGAAEPVGSMGAFPGFPYTNFFPKILYYNFKVNFRNILHRIKIMLCRLSILGTNMK